MIDPPYIRHDAKNNLFIPPREGTLSNEKEMTQLVPSPKDWDEFEVNTIDCIIQAAKLN